ncbi:protein phosphatase Slingshot homolog 1 isoform X2 [Clupea harengus]|uniref:Protein phosphatase Slingshot homolog 1 n=1 Tax=Clupea harengus TaxID=7950 RepID=A0A6P8GEZ7_CLUHA|nr:protein phosphatase Slingshot homolog 1 isoform X2 [Clupea harengus]
MHLVVESPNEAMLKVLPYFGHSQTEICRLLSESFFMVKGAALFLQQGGNSNTQDPRTPTHHKHAGDLPQHLQVMINTLRSEDRITLAVRLESVWSDRVRYMVVVYTNGRQDTEENILLGMDFTNKDSKSCSIGMVLPLWSDTSIHLDGDGGFSVNTAGHSHVFKPVSVQAMWSALQVLHKACEVSRRYNYFPGGMALTWTGYYESCISSEQSCINEWNAMTDLETSRPDSPTMFTDRPTERERTECLIKSKLRSVMMFQDLENVTSKEIRTELEQHMSCNLKEYKEFIDNEMLLILGQMDKATLIFDHLYLGSEWNASNLEELRDLGVGYILNVTREIDNFFPGTFAYHNIRVYDEEATDLLAHWNDTYNFIVRAKKNQSKCLVHCKMGVSRSASTVIAYAMKEYGWSLEKALNLVKQKRTIACPNSGFMRQLAEYEGILDASKQRHNKLWHPEGGGDEMPEGAQVCCGPEGERGEGEEGEPAWMREGGASASPHCCGGVVEMAPLDQLNYNYYFRRLSDTALDSEPSTPVRGPPLLGLERVFIEIEDVERDALLDDDGFPTPTLGPPLGEGTAAQTCSRLEPLEDMRLRLEFSTVEEEDEEEAQKEEAEMAALASGAAGGAGAEGGQDGGAVSRSSSGSSLANLNRFNNENANNSNRLANKRSCPPTFDDSASIRNPYKVKPSYQSCRDCLRLPSSRRCERSAGGRTHRLNPPRHSTLPTISIEPPRGAGIPFVPTRPSSSSSHMLQIPAASTRPPPAQPPCSHLCRCGRCPRCANRVLPGPAPPPMASLEAYRQQLVSPMNCEELQRDLQCPLETEDLEELQEEEEEAEKDEEEKRRGRQGAVSTGVISELTLLQLSLDGGERPVTELHQEPLSMKPVVELPQEPLSVTPVVELHQDALPLRPEAELHQKDLLGHTLTTGLVRQRLEQLSSLPLEDTLPKGSQPELMDLGRAGEEKAPHGPMEDMEIESGSGISGVQALETPVLSPGRALLPSSPLGCSLTRSSSSDSLASLASVRGGEPGLVRQRAQEIETRMRLAGLTIPSPLKRSNSLAKLGDLTLSTQDLSPSQLSDSSAGEQMPLYPALPSILAKSQSGVPQS